MLHVFALLETAAEFHCFLLLT